MEQDSSVTPAKALGLVAALVAAFGLAVGCFLVLRLFLAALLLAAILV